MDAVDHPLDWWADGGYDAVMREIQCTKAQARQQVHHAIKAYFRGTGAPRWRPIGHPGYVELRRAIMAGRVRDNDLR